ncbi:hypothetical protein [Streptomyces sp. NPDC057580]|uniref:hypothetical protein n=1 Tax=Streptomyces sp. NPDC057580 TaxID=3346173 RepID=UPI0036BBE7A1
MSSTPDDSGEPEPVRVTVTEPALVKDGPEGAIAVTATVTDPAHPKRAALFEYIGMPGHRLAPVSVTVGPAPDLPYDEYVSIPPRDLRDLPLARWESAARWRAELELGQGGSSDKRPESAEAWVFKLYPELRDDDTPAAQRRLRGLTHVADIAMEYATLSILGVKDPAAAIARRRDAKPATVRSWIHRARKAGFLPETQVGGRQ